MGAFLGLLLGVGLLLIVRGAGRGRLKEDQAVSPAPSLLARWRRRRVETLRRAGFDGIGPGQFVILQVVTAIAALVIVLLISATISVAVIFAVFGFRAPAAVVERLASNRAGELREVWPEVVDNLSSAVRAGLSLPEALASLGTRGPEQLRPDFLRFAADYRATGRFAECLDRLKDGLADPVGDRVCESLRMAREVGGTDLGRLLRTLSAFLREDARTRAELETRQGWTINAARLAVAAPWLVLLLLATQATTLAAYDTSAGVLVLVGGGLTCLFAYRLMLYLGRLPTEPRVLQ